MHTNFWRSTTAPNATDCGAGYTNLIWYNTSNNTAYRYNTTSSSWIAWATQGSDTGGGGVVKTDYANLKSLHDAGSLAPGQLYLITDYRTIYKQPDSSVLMGQASTESSSMNPSMIYQLLVLATGVSAIAHEAYVVSVLNDDGTPNTTYTPLCNQWKVWYDINNDGTLYSWASSSGMGVIYRLIDHKSNDLPYDFYNIMFRTYLPSHSSYATWSVDTDSSIGIGTIVHDSSSTSQLYVRVRTDANLDSSLNSITAVTPSKVPSVSPSNWKLVIDSVNNYLPKAGVTVYYDTNRSSDTGSDTLTNKFPTVSVDTTKYTDQLTFNGAFYSNRMEPTFDSGKQRLYTNVFNGDTYKNRFGAGFRDNAFNGNVYENEVSVGYRNNYVSGDFYQNNIGIDFGYNTIMNAEFKGNTVGVKCIRNSFGRGGSGNSISYNQIGNDFHYNIISDAFTGNMIGNGASNNILDITFKYNHVANNFYNNIIGQNFQYNTCESDFHNNTIKCNFVNNSIGNDFYANAIGFDMKRNIIGNRCNGNSIGNYCKMNTIGSSFEDAHIGNSFAGCNIGHAVSLTANDNLHFVNIPTMNYGENSWNHDSAGEESAEKINLVTPITDSEGNVITSFDGIYGLENNSYFIRATGYKTVSGVSTYYKTYKAFYYNDSGTQTFIF